MKIYNKLVRDRIPEIIKESGKDCEVRILKDKEYFNELNKKLNEELKEYIESGSVEELADIAEIIYAIAKFKGINKEEFEVIREEKTTNRGEFEKKLFLVKVWERR